MSPEMCNTERIYFKELIVSRSPALKMNFNGLLLSVNFNNFTNAPVVQLILRVNVDIEVQVFREVVGLGLLDALFKT